MDRLQLIKYKRLKPEERFLYDILVELKPVKSTIIDSTIYLYEDEEIFDYNPNNCYFWCNYFRIWFVLKMTYNLSDTDSKLVILKMVKNILKLTDIKEEWIN